jgi:6-phosphogluconolactonase (cycloisomerase 2 family)
MNERMSRRLWLLGVGILVSVGLLVACGSKYNASSNGLLLVGSQGSGLIETFSFSLNNGHISSISNSPGATAKQSCVLKGQPSSIVIDPAGAYAYAILQGAACNVSGDVIAAFKINSDGTVTQTGTPVTDPNPVSLTMDSAGKFLFVAEGASSTAITNSAALNTACKQNQTHFGVCVYSIGSGASLTPVQPTFTAPPTALAPTFVALAASPTVFPGTGINGTQNSVCSVGNNAPTAEFLYAVDSINYVVWQFAVDMSTGVLGNPPGTTVVPLFNTDQVPAGIAVDPCDRFAYVSDSLTNKVSAYTICTTVQLTTPCPVADGRLVEVAGSPYSLTGNANGPGPIAVDPYGNNVYVVGTLSNTVSGFKISPTSGTLTAMTPAVVATGLEPKSIAIRGDDNWMFVANHNAATVSQYSITPASGALSAAAPIQTDNYPWGVAVK